MPLPRSWFSSAVPSRALRCAGAVLALALAAAPLRAQPSEAPYVTAAGGGGRFPLSAGGRSVPLHAAEGEDAGVIRALRSLQDDVERVTGARPEVAVGAVPAARQVVLVGTLGRSPAIDALVRAGRLDVAAVAGRWETFVLQVVDRPAPGVDRALVIAGSDRCGTIFGIYELSERIGVSPWYWWADAPVRRQPALHVRPAALTRGTPAVRYRGIFINDEAPALSGWAHETFGGFNARFYERVFELILRLRGNLLWPAMWGNAMYADDPATGPLAHEMGVVIGTSHHEPMMRAHDEWRRFGQGAWDYTTNAPALQRFWRESAARSRDYETLTTVGMRGDGDEPMTEGTATALLERILADQRRILAEVTGRDAAAVPQVWALYKEVQDYYDGGMRVPDDVTLLFADDNWGNIRRLPRPEDRGRPGGFGVYYHFDYVGGPRNYKWINTNPIARVAEQMHLAWRAGADRMWIVNVGDIKPMELPTSFFLDLAWDPAAWPAERIPEYHRRWAAQQFGEAHAAEIAAVLSAYTRYNGRRKPELLDTATYSLTAYREAERAVEDYRRVADEAERIGRLLPADARDAYVQLVLHPVLASANLHELYATAARNRLYARQGRAATNTLADRARALFARDAELTRIYHEDVAGGKWRHMMSQTHIGYTYWQQPDRDVMPRVDVIHVPAAAEMGVAAEGPPAPGEAEDPGPGPRPLVLPAFEPYGRRQHFVDVYNRGRTPFAFTAQSAEPWVTVSPASGTVDEETRLWVSVDWSRAPKGVHRVPVTVAGAGRRVTVTAVVENRGERATGFVEANGYVSMEAAHFARAVPAGGAEWRVLPELGRTLSAVTPYPVVGEPRTPGRDAPRLEYAMHLVSTGTATVRVYLSPSLDTRGGGGLRFALSMDDGPPQVVNMHADGSSAAGDRNAAWERMVADNAQVVTATFRVDRPGAHVLTLWAVDPGVVVQKLVVETAPLPPTYLGPPESPRAP